MNRTIAVSPYTAPWSISFPRAHRGSLHPRLLGCLTPGVFGASLHLKLLGCLTPGSLESLHMQNFWDICARRGLEASLHPILLGCLTPRVSGV